MMAPEKDKQTLARTTTLRIHSGQSGHAGLFKPGNPGGPGRPKGSPNKIKGDLAQMILNAATWTGYIKTADDGARIAGGGDGCEEFLRWLCLHHPKTMVGLLARILPYHASVEPPGSGILSREETLAQLRERGLPEDLIDAMRKAPELLDPGSS
jgi:hypothetical protein